MQTSGVGSQHDQNFAIECFPSWAKMQQRRSNRHIIICTSAYFCGWWCKSNVEFILPMKTVMMLGYDSQQTVNWCDIKSFEPVHTLLHQVVFWSECKMQVFEHACDPRSSGTPQVPPRLNPNRRPMSIHSVGPDTNTLYGVNIQIRNF